MKELKIIVPENAREFGEKVQRHLSEMRGNDETYVMHMNNHGLIRFNNGEGKCVIEESIRDKDLYILADVSNRSVTYNLCGETHRMSPDEHFMDILRILSAECGHASKRTLIMPYLYSSRQDRKEARESLDCAMSLQWLVEMGVNEIVTCDVHNKGVMNAVPKTPFENVYLTDTMLTDLILTEGIFDYENIICISPDEGAMKRARFFSEVIDNATMAAFYKYRDQKVSNGNAKVREHRFLGDANDLIGKIAIVTDDMIDTGGSILDTAKQLKELGVDKVYLLTTFAFFSKGIEKFNAYYECGYIDRVYATNLAYVPEEAKSQPWFRSIDCSKNIAFIINELNHGRSIGEVIKGRDAVLKRVRQIREERGRKSNEIE